MTDRPEIDGVESRVLDAALVCIARVGVTKTTIDDVAREAACSRATLYRYFPGKQQLLEAAVAREMARLAGALERAGAECTTFADAVVALVVTAARHIADSAALQTVLVVEPEVLLPYITFEASDVALARAGDLATPVLATFLENDRAHRFGEWLGRIVFSYLLSPSEFVNLTDPDSVRELVHDFVVPSLAGVATPKGCMS